MKVPAHELEGNLCKTFIAHLHYRSLTWKHKYFITHIPNEQMKPSIKYSISQKAKGVVKGMPDYVVFNDKGQGMAIEFKNGSFKDPLLQIKNEQKDVMLILQGLNVPYHACNDTDIAIELVRKFTQDIDL
jgi:hypothetical protein